MKSTPSPLMESTSNTQYILGDVIRFGDGTARSWVRIGTDGKPIQAGITLTEDAFSGLPATVTPGMIWAVEYILKFPEDVPNLPFDHIGVNWNPAGHAPSSIYGLPHFDFHFYTIKPEERMSITARGDDLEKCRKLPPSGMLSDSYIQASDSEEPGMGTHWIDPESHEFHGDDFTKTFLFGTYDGRVIFYEPMITVAYLKTRPNADFPVALPDKFAADGYYPTKYSIRYDEKRREYTVALENLVFKSRLTS